MSDIRSGGGFVHGYRKIVAESDAADPTSLGNIAMHLPDDVNLSVGLVLQSSKKPAAMTLLKEYLGILASADNPTPAGRSTSFISMNGSKVQVEFEIIARRLRQTAAPARSGSCGPGATRGRRRTNHTTAAGHWDDGRETGERSILRDSLR